MAGLWVRNWPAQPTENEWNRVSLQWGITYQLDAQGGAPQPCDPALPATAAPAPRLVACRPPDANEARWVLLTAVACPLRRADSVYLNGLPLTTGIRVLRDRDEIMWAGARRLYITYVDPIQVIPFPGAAREIRCARCRRVLAPGEPVIQCPNPNCRAWHHQDPAGELECWTYAERCAACDQLTGQENEAWTPAAIDPYMS